MSSKESTKTATRVNATCRQSFKKSLSKRARTCSPDFPGRNLLHSHSTSFLPLQNYVAGVKTRYIIHRVQWLIRKRRKEERTKRCCKKHHKKRGKRCSNNRNSNNIDDSTTTSGDGNNANWEGTETVLGKRQAQAWRRGRGRIVSCARSYTRASNGLMALRPFGMRSKLRSKRISS